jgi:undecaprenyl-diphosphatase
VSLLLALPLAAAAGETAAPVAESVGGIGLWEGIFLGLIQGVTEFIPVSSSGHLAVGHMIWGKAAHEAERAFDVAVHAATLFAMVLYFRDDIVNLLRKRPRLLGLIVLGCVPAALIGGLFKNWFEGLAVSAYVVGGAFIINGLFLIASRFFGIETKRLEDLRPSDSLLVGFAQAVALTPGISRAGMTITSGLICGLRRTEAFTFSFLLGMPVIAGAAAYKLKNIGQLAVGDSWLGLLAGFVAAFVSGLAAVWVLAQLVKRRNLLPFGIYTVALGVVVIGVKIFNAIRGG